MILFSSQYSSRSPPQSLIKIDFSYHYAAAGYYIENTMNFLLK